MSWAEESFPISYRVIFLFNLGVVYYNVLVVLCYRYFDIDVLRILNLKRDYASQTHIINNVTDFTRAYTITNILSWVLYKLALSQLGYVFALEIIPTLTMITNLYVILINGHQRVFQTLTRVLVGKLDFKSLRINDILISDSLTSYSKIILNFATYCAFVYHGKYQTFDDNQGYGLDLLILAAPQLIRLSQCWREYAVSNYKNKQALYNFGKYSTNVLPLTIIYITRFKTTNNSVLRLEKLLICINSMYTFCWDIFVDWDYNTLKQSAKFKQAWFKNFFYFSCFNDFLLRFIWLTKFIFTNFYYFHDTEVDPQFSLFLMQLLEVTRRFIWCIHRMNTEALKFGNEDIDLDDPLNK